MSALRPAIAAAAQKVVDEWRQDEEGLDPELGAGGVCDRVADAIIGTLYANLDAVEAALGAPEGEDHQWVVASDGYAAFVVDIPCHVYETGGGYAWRKIEGAEIGPHDVLIERIDLGLAQDLLKEGTRMDRMRKIAQRPPEPPIVPPRLPPPQPKTAPLPPEGARQARRQFLATIETIKGVLEHILQSKDDRWLKRLGGGRRERGWKAIAMMVDDLNTTRRTVAAYPEKDELKAAAYLLGENERLWNRYKRLFGDHPLWPAQEARMRRRRGEMERGLVALAEALEALGDGNSAALARVLAAPQLAGEAQGWADRFFRANPEFMDRAERFAEAKGIDLAQYLNQLDSMREDMGRRMIHRDLGYVGMPWSPAGKPSRKPLRPEAELRWPFPPPNVLQDERAFIAAALAWAMGGGLGAYERMYGSAAGLRDTGRRGEIQAARAYLRHLMKDVAPQLAATLQAKWREASAGGDAEAQRALRVWWGTLSDVWELLQDMVGSINAYERGD